MRTLYFFGVLASVSAVACIAVCSVGCSPPHTAAGTTTTAADVSSTSPTEATEAAATPAAPAAPEAAQSDAPALPGQLVCRTKSPVDGTTEVYLEWTGSSAKGTLRREAPSGMVYVQRVQAERADSLIIVDEPSNEDLMSHAAVIGKQDGKTLMRMGGAGQPWTACQ